MPQSVADFIPNDTLLVLDLTSGAWLGMWKSDKFRLRRFLRFHAGTDPRVAILGATGDAWGMFPPAPPETDAGDEIVMEARAAVRVDLRQSLSATLVAEVEHCGGRYRIDSSADGVGETSMLRDRIPDPTASRKFGATVDMTDSDGNLWAPYREDYALEMPEEGTDLTLEGWQLGARQRRTETVRLPRRGRAFTLACASEGGAVGFRSLAIVTVNKPMARGSEV